MKSGQRYQKPFIFNKEEDMKKNLSVLFENLDWNKPHKIQQIARNELKNEKIYLSFSNQQIKIPEKKYGKIVRES